MLKSIEMSHNMSKLIYPTWKIDVKNFKAAKIPEISKNYSKNKGNFIPARSINDSKN